MERITKLLTERWSIVRGEYDALMLTVLPTLRAGNLAAVSALLDRNQVKAYAMNPMSTMPYVADRWELDDANLPMGSVAVLQVEGTLYSWETFRLERLLQKVADNNRISGVVLWINGPGGMVSRVDVAAKAIKELGKPVATYVAGTMASAHLWLGTAAQRVFVSSPLCQIGSLGVMTEYTDYSQYYKQLGIDRREIYPDTADLKNAEVRAIREKDDETLVKKRLMKLHEAFAHDVAEHRGLTYDPKSEVFRGQLYNGDEAIAVGLADQLGTLTDAVMWVVTRAMVERVSR